MHKIWSKLNTVQEEIIFYMPPLHKTVQTFLFKENASEKQLHVTNFLEPAVPHNSHTSDT